MKKKKINNKTKSKPLARIGLVSVCECAHTYVCTCTHTHTHTSIYTLHLMCIPIICVIFYNGTDLSIYTYTSNVCTYTHLHIETHTQAPTCAFEHAQTLSVWGLETIELLSGFHLRLNRETTNTMRS